MTEQEAAAILGRWYRAADVHRQKTIAVLLFGIAYAADLEGLDLKEVTRIGTGHRYSATLNTGITLSRYVKIERWPHWASPRP